MISLRKIGSADLHHIWAQGYSQVEPVWAKYDAPFLHTYQQLTWERFNIREAAFFKSDHVAGIFNDDQIIGAVNYYWENEKTRWLEIGLVIFSEGNWSQGYGSEVIKQWTSAMFEKFPMIQRVGFTTWSGNQGMARLGEKNNFSLEARLRKVRYFEGEYYDELRYGILRSEWEQESC